MTAYGSSDQNFTGESTMNILRTLSYFDPYKHTTWIPRWNDVETVVSTSFQREVHVVSL